MSYDKVDVPDDGEAITLADEETGELNVPENPIIPIIHGDGIGTDVGPAAQKVLDAAAEATGRSIAWMRVYAGVVAPETCTTRTSPRTPSRPFATTASRSRAR